MTPELLVGLATFAFVTSITPGPNNLMLLSSGANYGFRRSLPHMAGITLGHVFMTVLVGVGVLELFEIWPWLFQLMMLLSIAYLLYLAWRIATASAPEASDASGRPLTFLQAALFQWVNPKAWAMSLTAVTVYTEQRSFSQVLVVAGCFGLVNLPSVSAWAAAGQQLRRWLLLPGRLRVFNIVMAVLLVASLVPVWLVS